MKSALRGFALCLVACSPALAQTGFAGTWDVTELNIRIRLVVEGTTVTGAVGDLPLMNSRVDGSTILIQWKSPDGDRTLSARGRLTGDQIHFVREPAVVREGGNPGGSGFHGSGAPREFTVRRATGGAATSVAIEHVDREFSAAINVPNRNVKVEGRLFLPASIARVEAVIASIRWGNGSYVFDAPEWRTLATQSDVALLRVDMSTISAPANYRPAAVGSAAPELVAMLLRRFSEEVKHPEVATAPLVFWGHSAGGGLAVSLAEVDPSRTVAFIGYQSGAARGGNLNVTSKVPALLFAGGRDTSVPRETVETVWRQGRTLGAPWSLAIDPAGEHGSEESFGRANAVMIPWVKAVLAQRLTAAGAALRPVSGESGWLGDTRTYEARPHDQYRSSKVEATWLPDEATANAWRVLAGGPR